MDKQTEIVVDNPETITYVKDEIEIHADLQDEQIVDKLESTAAEDNSSKPSKKRKRPDGSSQASSTASASVLSNDTPKKKKKCAQDLKIYIVNTPNIIRENQLNEIGKMLMNALDNHLAIIPAPERIPTFKGPKFHNGMIEVSCTDSFSAQWLQSTIASLPSLSDGAILETKSASQLRGPTIRFFISSGFRKPTFEEVAKRLHLQNKPLDTSNWIAWKALEMDGGVFYYVSVNDQHVSFIKAKNCRLFYCFTKIKIKLPKESKEGGAEGAGNVKYNANKDEAIKDE